MLKDKRKLSTKRRNILLIVGFVLILLSGVLNTLLFPRMEPAPPVAAQVSNVVSGTTGFADNPDPRVENMLPVEILSTSEYVQFVEDFTGTVTDAQLNSVTGVTAAVYTVEGEDSSKIFASRFLEEQYPQIIETYETAGTEINIVSPSTRIVADDNGGVKTTTLPPTVVGNTGLPFGWTLAITFLLVAIILFAFRSLFTKGALGIMGAGKDAVTPPETRFSDVAGCDEAVEELSEIVAFLKDPERFSRAGARMSRGALLVGPAGTGKTLLARAVAGEAGVPFYSVAGSDFVEMFVGVGAKRVRELFAKAKKHPEGAIIFIDEIDAVGRKRSTGTHANANQEQEGTLNSLLVEMDGFAKTNIIVIGATNRADILDEALTRPGRLDRKVMVGLPDRLGRERIFAVHAKDRKLSDNVDFGILARRTSGMSGADIEQVVNEACMEAARADRDTVTGEDFSSALATVAMGKARTSAVVTEHDRRVTAWHEAGHTVTAMVLPDAENPVSVSIIPRGPAGGVTWMAEGDDLFLTRKKAFARLVVAMSGRAAEELLLDGEFTSGPHSDLNHATNIALAMVTQYGMSDVGLMIRSEGLLSTGSQITDETVAAVEGLLAEALTVARETLKEHRQLFDSVVDALLEYETLGLEQLLELQAGTEMAATPAPPTPFEYRKHKGESDENSPNRNREYTVSDVVFKSPSTRVRKRLAGAFVAALGEWRRNSPRKAHG